MCGTTSFLKKRFGQYFYLEVDRLDANEALNKDLMTLLNSSNEKYKGSRPSIANAQDRQEKLLNSLYTKNNDASPSKADNVL